MLHCRLHNRSPTYFDLSVEQAKHGMLYQPGKYLMELMQCQKWRGQAQVMELHLLLPIHCGASFVGFLKSPMKHALQTLGTFS